MSLQDLGWNDFFESAFEPYRARQLTPARVIRVNKGACRIATAAGDRTAEVTGRLIHESAHRADLPTVGDWVAVEIRGGHGSATIQAVLPRRTKFSRRSVSTAGRFGGDTAEEQVVAANIDVVFLLTGLDGEFNAARLERYMSLARESGAHPVIALNKADLCDDIDYWREAAAEIAPEADVHALSALEGEGVDALRAYLTPGRTIAALGSSGVGKSTLINCLLGEDRLKVSAVRDSDRRGRHATSWRELIRLPGGAMIIDTPGMRDVQIWLEQEAIREAFDDIEALAGQCRFADCRHEEEPDCAVRLAYEEERLDAGRYANYLKLQDEWRQLEALRVERERKDRRRGGRG